MHIYFVGVLISLLILAVTFLVKLRKVRTNHEVYEVTLGDLFFAVICVFGSWTTAIVFVIMCINSNLEHKVIKKF